MNADWLADTKLHLSMTSVQVWTIVHYIAIVQCSHDFCPKKCIVSLMLFYTYLLLLLINWQKFHRLVVHIIFYCVKGLKISNLLIPIYFTIRKVVWLKDEKIMYKKVYNFWYEQCLLCRIDTAVSSYTAFYSEFGVCILYSKSASVDLLFNETLLAISVTRSQEEFLNNNKSSYFNAIVYNFIANNLGRKLGQVSSLR